MPIPAEPERAERTHDDRVARLAVRAGLVTEADLRAARAAVGRASKQGSAAAPKLEDVLLQQGLIAREGFDKLHALIAAETDPRLKIPGYDILEVLGRGGMGIVYLARQKSLDRLVALKVLDPEQALGPNYLDRFMTEARALARLNHENIIAGIDVGEANGYHYFAMEYVEGESLDLVIAREGALPEKRALRVGAQMCRALAHAQRSGLVHRDIKPQNIMLTRHDQAKLCDLGLAMADGERQGAREERGQAVGTPHYVSPEQARGERRVDIRSDLYSLGATLYHAVTGKTPFEGGSAMVLMTRHLTEEPVPAYKRKAGVSRGISQLIDKMMAKAPEDRYQDPLACLEDVDRLLEGRPPLGVPPERADRSERAPERRPAAASEGPARRRIPIRSGGFSGGAAAGLVVVLVLCLGGGYVVYRYRSGAAARARSGAPATPEEEAEAQRLLQEAVQYFTQNRAAGDAAALRFRVVVETYPNTRAAESARSILDRDFGEVDENDK